MATALAALAAAASPSRTGEHATTTTTMTTTTIGRAGGVSASSVRGSIFPDPPGRRRLMAGCSDGFADEIRNVSVEVDTLTMTELRMIVARMLYLHPTIVARASSHVLRMTRNDKDDNNRSQDDGGGRKEGGGVRGGVEGSERGGGGGGESGGVVVAMDDGEGDGGGCGGSSPRRQQPRPEPPRQPQPQPQPPASPPLPEPLKPADADDMVDVDDRLAAAVDDDEGAKDEGDRGNRNLESGRAGDDHGEGRAMGEDGTPPSGRSTVAPTDAETNAGEATGASDDGMGKLPEESRGTERKSHPGGAARRLDSRTNSRLTSTRGSPLEDSIRELRRLRAFLGGSPDDDDDDDGDSSEAEGTAEDGPAAVAVGAGPPDPDHKAADGRTDRGLGGDGTTPSGSSDAARNAREATAAASDGMDEGVPVGTSHANKRVAEDQISPPPAARGKNKRAKTTSSKSTRPTWDDRFDELVHLKSILGHTKPTKTFVDRYPQYKQLFYWANTMRSYRNHIVAGERPPKPTLTTERMRRLESIGFEWSVKPQNPRTTWEDRFDQTLELKAILGHTKPSAQWLRDNPSWYSWLRWAKTQRSREKAGREGRRTVGQDGLTEERIRKLNAIGFEWWNVDSTRGGGGGRARIAREFTNDDG